MDGDVWSVVAAFLPVDGKHELQRKWDLSSTQDLVSYLARMFTRKYDIAKLLQICTSGRNLGTLSVTNGFLCTSAYVIISVSFAAPPKKIAQAKK